MLSVEDIKALVSKRELEEVNLELKSWKKILPDGDKKPEEAFNDLAYEIAAFANRYGGKLIIGISNDGTFDGKFTGDIDKLKERLYNLCRDKISPGIACDFQLIETDEWDVFVVYIPKRRYIPHACVPNREGHEIKSRIYYIRTNHGKKLISDVELEWLFKNQEDPDYSHKFRILAEFNKDLVLINYSGHSRKGDYSINNFLYGLSKEDKEYITENNERFRKFILELYPYLIVRSLSDYFNQSWYIGMRTIFDRTSSGPMREPHDIDSLIIEQIPDTGTEILHKLSWNFPELLNYNLTSRELKVPPKTKIRIEFKEKSSIIHFENPIFNIQILIGSLAYGSGLHQKNPLYEVQMERFQQDAQKYAAENFYFFDGAGWITGKFDFPEFDIDEFKRILHYFNTLKVLIDDEWNFEKVLENLVPKELRVMHNKIDDLMRMLSPNSTSDA